MKLHFEPDLDFQLQAIESVCDLFRGQEICRTEFTVTKDVAGGFLPGMESDLGIGNRLALLDDELLANVSATHADKHHMVYRLDAVEAYQRKLVKQIEVDAATIDGGHNKPYVRVVSVIGRRGVISAKVELDVATTTGVRRVEKVVHDGDNLEQTTNRAIYANCRIGEIRVERGNQYVELRVPGGEQYLKPGEASGDVDLTSIQREMIRRTIRQHLDKEKRLRPQGIKVLSLFFIDAVGRYREYDEDGAPVKGEYARIFEEEYRLLAKLPDYATLFQEVDLDRAAEDVHAGYFSIDRKSIAGKTVEVFRDTRGDTKADDDTYSLIMKDKEKLLLFETPLKFIFSHSALREGWDNPNVFQICTLRDIRTERGRRQTIGRGLRLCVNQDGERVRGFDVNTLTVVATESFQDFADNLQKEIEAETGIRFGIVESHQFAAVTVAAEDGQATPLGFEQSKVVWEQLKAAGYIGANGKVQESLKKALADGTVTVPEAFVAQRDQIVEVLKKVTQGFVVKNAADRRPVRPRQALLHSDEFKALWDRIKHKTTYRVEFDNEKLVESCIRAVQSAPAITKTRLQWRKADIVIGQGGVEATERPGAATVVLDERDVVLPDLLTDLQDRTQLTRRTIYRVLIGSHRLDDFVRNPQQFIEIVAEAINRCKRLVLVEGIKYQRLGDESYYAQELFEREELTGYLKNMLQDTQKSVYEHVIYDSGSEATFADQLEKNDAVRVYAKLPGWFTVPTPLGGYNPDWAVLVQTDEGERVYFVVETKGSLFEDDLRHKEGAKIACGKAHFAALAVRERPAEYRVENSVADLIDKRAPERGARPV